MTLKRQLYLICLLTATCLLVVPAASGADKILRLATTTSTENSGLLKVLLPAFERDTGYTVHVIAVGTGKALKMGQDGDVDVIMVHARADEEKFVAAGYGVNRRDLMYNDFVIVGPKHDPAKLRQAPDAATALTRIAEQRVAFISRGDESGTHKKETEIWKARGLSPSGGWYRAIGQGMEQALQMASETQGYALTDRGTWLVLRSKLDLEIVHEGDERLFNPYGIVAVNPARYADVNYQGAMALIAWLTSIPGQKMIADFTADGAPLFFPVAVQAKNLPR
jgi:tungstate transport system substrate-binding protein